jgi:hypothetical protein
VVVHLVVQGALDRLFGDRADGVGLELRLLHLKR